MYDSSSVFTLITGGSAGIGRALAEACARRHMNLLLVALPGPELEETASFILTTWNVNVKTFGIDLSALDAPAKVFQWCLQEQAKVNILINDAGMAGTAIFETSDLSYSDMRIMVNIRALTLLTRLFLPMLKEFDRSYVLNIGSLSGYYSIPYKSVYSASKAYVLHFSQAIREELKNTPVQISVVCPNGVETNQGTFGRISAHGFMGKVTKINKDVLAEYALDKMFRGKTTIIPGRINRFLLAAGKLIPDSFIARLLNKEFTKEVKVS